MTWPLDAKHTTCGDGDAAHSDLFLEIEDRVVDLHRLQRISLLAGLCVVDGSSDPSWGMSGTSPEDGWVCRNTNSMLVIPIECRANDVTGARIKRVQAKVYNTSTATIQMDLHKVTLNMQDENIAPSLGSTEGGIAASSDTSWEVLDVAELDVQVGDDELTIVLFTLATSGDIVADVMVDIEPLTPTP